MLYRGDVVLLAFPFSDGRGVKVRPALVVQSDRNNRRWTNTIVVMITTTIARSDAEPTQVRLRIGSVAGKSSGLLFDSAIKCENVFTVEQRMIQRVIGRLPSDMMRRVDACLRAALGMR
jgi:mRNA interferase MazF